MSVLFCTRRVMTLSSHRASIYEYVCFMCWSWVIIFWFVFFFSISMFHCSDNRKVVIVEKLPVRGRNHRHVSYHGDICTHVDVVNGVSAAGTAEEGGRSGMVAPRSAASRLTGQEEPGERSGVAVHEAEAWGTEGLLLGESDSQVMRRASRVIMYVLAAIIHFLCFQRCILTAILTS